MNATLYLDGGGYSTIRINSVALSERRIFQMTFSLAFPCWLVDDGDAVRS